MIKLRKLILRACLLLLCCGSVAAKPVQHYVFFNRDRERIHDQTFLASKFFAGAQIKYTWRELEPERDAYNFSAVRDDLQFLTAHGKRLFIQLQDVSFDQSIVPVPRYLLQDPQFHGGANQQYNVQGDTEAHAVAGGWVARRWDPAVQERFAKLLFALGREFDGRIEGINLPETALDFGESGRLFPKGFSFESYQAAVLRNMAALKRAFPKSVTMQYANFMPGGWAEKQNELYLGGVYRRAKELGVGVGGPDLLPYKPGQMKHSYPFIRACAGYVPTGIAVQFGNYEFQNPRTGRPVRIQELLAFATDYLKVDYIFWSTQEPYYSKQLIPFLKGAGV